MNYFDGQIFPVYGDVPESSGMWENHPEYYGIQYNHAGKLRFSVDGGPEIETEGPHVFVTSPGHVFRYGCGENESRHHCFICTCGERVRSYVAGGLLELEPEAKQPVPVLNPERFLLTMLEIMSLLRGSAVVPPRAVLLYEDLLLQISESKRGKTPLSPYCREKLSGLADRIREAPEKAYDFADEAAKCCVTQTHFRRQFKQMFQVPPQQFLIHCRLAKAAMILLHESAGVAEAAERSGFADPGYFAR